MKDKFYNKNGSLTMYAFACGYIERKTVGQNTIDLFKDGCWHVQARNNNQGRYLWECFDTLTQARKCFNQQKKVA